MNTRFGKFEVQGSEFLGSTQHYSSPAYHASLRSTYCNREILRNTQLHLSPNLTTIMCVVTIFLNLIASVIAIELAISEERIPTTQSQNPRDPMIHDTLDLIEFDQGYNLHSYPKPVNASHPLEVGFQVNLRNVLEVNEVSQICTLETTIRLYWTDRRIKLRQVVFMFLN